MAGKYREPNSSGSNSDRISEELFEAFNMDDMDMGTARRSKGRSQVSSGSSRRPSGRGGARKRRRRKKDRQMLVIIAAAVLLFLLVVGIVCSILLWDIPALPAIAVLVLNLAVGVILGPAFLVIPILMVAVEIAAGIFASQILLAVMGCVLLAAAQVFHYLIR